MTEKRYDPNASGPAPRPGLDVIFHPVSGSSFPAKIIRVNEANRGNCQLFVFRDDVVVDIECSIHFDRLGEETPCWSHTGF